MFYSNSPHMSDKPDLTAIFFCIAILWVSCFFYDVGNIGMQKEIALRSGYTLLCNRGFWPHLKSYYGESFGARGMPTSLWITALKSLITDLQIQMLEFSWNIGVSLFDLLTVTFKVKLFWTVHDQRGPFCQTFIIADLFNLTMFPSPLTDAALLMTQPCHSDYFTEIKSDM